MMLFRAGLVDLRLNDASEWTSASASLTPNIAAAPNPTPRTFKRSRNARLESPLSFSSRCISWACWSFSLSLILASHLTKTWQQALDFERAAPNIAKDTVLTMKCQVPAGGLPGYPDRNPAMLRAADAAERGERTPMSGRTGGGWAPASNGNAAAPPSSVMKSRRFMPDMGLSHPRAAGLRHPQPSTEGPAGPLGDPESF